MKHLYYILLLLAVSFSATLNAAETERNGVLIIASYNPDTQRMSSFINDFEREILNFDSKYVVYVENLNCKSVNDAASWESRMNGIFNKYLNNNIKAVILLGQEAFATYVSANNPPKDVPFFACFASDYGLNVPIINEESLNMADLAIKKGIGGGVLNHYDVAKNIDLILSLYPDTKTIAFVSDNTYGGISLQALVRKEMANYPKLDLQLIDSRKVDYQNVNTIIGKLPENSVILLGTWRVDRNDMYMMNNSLTNLTSANPNLPVFSLTGTGLCAIAIGGYVPNYATNGKEIAQQIHDYYGENKTIGFVINQGTYTFEKGKLREFEIRESHLPKGSVITDSAAEIIAKYRVYIFTAIGVIVLLVFLMTWLYRVYSKNKRLQKELMIAKDRAEESDRIKSSFIANMGHEIRTPLNAIVGFTTLLCEDPFPADSKDDYCDIIGKNSNLLLTLINDILDISRMEAGKMIFTYNFEEVSSICEQVILTTEHMAKDGVKIEFDDKGAGNVIINTDVQRISQVLINLMTNAIKFTNKGSVLLSYEVSNDKVIFSVTDTGSGVPLENQKSIFNRFEKLNNHIQGTGLGLAICKQISTHLGGDVWMDPTYKNGARFFFSHPINKSED